MDQISFAQLEYDQKRRKTRREKFLEKMEKLVPWERLEQQIESYYPKPGNGRRSYLVIKAIPVHHK